MATRYVLICLMLLAACAHEFRDDRGGRPVHQPDQRPQGGSRTDFVTRYPVDQTATCLARRVRERGGLSAHVRDSDGPGILEVMVRGARQGTFSLLKVEPRGAGSLVWVWADLSDQGVKEFAGFLSGACG